MFMGFAALSPFYEVGLAQSSHHDRRIHPGSGRRRGGDFPKGRQVDPAPCMGGCDKAPVVAIGHALHESATPDSVAAAVAAGHVHPEIPAYTGLDAYRAGGGYRLLQACLGGQRPVEDIIKTLEDSG